MRKVKNVAKRILFGLAGVLGLAVTGGILYGITWILGKAFKGMSWIFSWLSARFPILFEKLQAVRLDLASVVTGILLVIAFMIISSITMWLWQKIKMRKAGKNKKEKTKKPRFKIVSNKAV